MYNPRLLLQLPLLLLGSCVPTTPNVDVTIYTVGAPVEHTGDYRHREDPPPLPPGMPVINAQASSQANATTPALPPLGTTCHQMQLAAARAYQPPPVPDLSAIDPKDGKAIADALLANIRKLRGELTNLQKDYICTLESGSSK